MSRRVVLSVESLLARTVEEGECLLWQGALLHGRPNVSMPLPDGRWRHVGVRFWLAVLAGDAQALADERAFAAGARRQASWVARCGEPLCVRPEHTQRLGKSASGRRAGRAMWTNVGARARAVDTMTRRTRESRGKLSTEQVRQLSVLVAQAGSQRKAAALLGVSQQRVSKLLERQAQQALRPGGVFAGLVKGGAL